jgi:hypothetical protein
LRLSAVRSSVEKKASVFDHFYAFEVEILNQPLGLCLGPTDLESAARTRNRRRIHSGLLDARIESLNELLFGYLAGLQGATVSGLEERYAQSRRLVCTLRIVEASQWL